MFIHEGLVNLADQLTSFIFILCKGRSEIFKSRVCYCSAFLLVHFPCLKTCFRFAFLLRLLAILN